MLAQARAASRVSRHRSCALTSFWPCFASCGQLMCPSPGGAAALPRCPFPAVWGTRGGAPPGRDKGEASRARRHLVAAPAGPSSAAAAGPCTAQEHLPRCTLRKRRSIVFLRGLAGVEPFPRQECRSRRTRAYPSSIPDSHRYTVCSHPVQRAGSWQCRGRPQETASPARFSRPVPISLILLYVYKCSL